MLTNVVAGVTGGVILGAFLTPFSVWAWSRVRRTDWWGFLTRVVTLRLRDPEYRPTGVFTFGKVPSGVRDWIRG